MLTMFNDTFSVIFKQLNSKGGRVVHEIWDLNEGGYSRLKGFSWWHYIEKVFNEGLERHDTNGIISA